jgi:RimJ/RimL family protein N-acetyltransferase
MIEHRAPREYPMFPNPFRLRPDDAARYASFRLRMLTDAPWAFSASPEDDPALDSTGLVQLFQEAESAVFAVEAPAYDGALAGPGRALVAAAGIMRMKCRKFAHRSRIWGVFVEPRYRGRGLAGAVLRTAIDLGRSWPGLEYVDLTVSENAPDAQRVYEKLGFRPWGREPEATDHEGMRYDEIHMTLKL